MTDELFTKEDAIAALQKGGKKIYFNAGYIGNVVEIAITFIGKSNDVDKYHICGDVEDEESQFFGDTIDNWISTQEYERLKLEKLSGKWFIF